MDSLDQFIENLLTEKGITHSNPEVMKEYRMDLMTRLSARINAEMVAKLAPEKIQELHDILDVDVEPEILREFFMSNVPTYQDVFAQTLQDFRLSYLS